MGKWSIVRLAPAAPSARSEQHPKGNGVRPSSRMIVRVFMEWNPNLRRLRARSGDDLHAKYVIPSTPAPVFAHGVAFPYPENEPLSRFGMSSPIVKTKFFILHDLVIEPFVCIAVRIVRTAEDTRRLYSPLVRSIRACLEGLARLENIPI